MAAATGLGPAAAARVLLSGGQQSADLDPRGRQLTEAGVGHVTVPPAVAQAGGTGRDAPLQRAAALLDVEQLIDYGVLGLDLLSVLRAGLGIVRGQPAAGPGQ